MTAGLRWGAASDVGLVREVNEDSKLHQPPLFAVADGMGGHSAGDLASQIAIETLVKTGVTSGGVLPEAVRKANRAIFEKASSEEGLSGMGTTIIAMYADAGSAQLVHVGDCRAYLLRDGQLTRLTTDHTVVERLVQEGRILAEDADRHPQRSYLERALGIDPNVEVDVKAMDTMPGDRFLLCSDGLFGMIDEDQIRDVLSTEKDPEKASKLLCRLAVEAGGKDNVTVIVVDYPGEPPGSTAAAPDGKPGAVLPPPPPPVQARPAREQKRSGRRLLGLVLLTVLVLAAAAGATAAIINGSWYVGQSAGRVAVFQGQPGSIAGIDLSKNRQTSDLKVADLPDAYQRRLSRGMPASSREDAQSIVRNLRRLAQPPLPAPEPAPSPAAEPPPAPAGQTPAAAGAEVSR